MKVLKFKQLNEALSLEDIANSMDMNVEDFENSSDLMDLAQNLMDAEIEYDRAMLEAELALEMYIDDGNDISFIYNKSLFGSDKDEYLANFNKLQRDIVSYARKEKFNITSSFKQALCHELGKFIKKNVK